MTQQEYNVIDRHLKNVSLRNIITLVVCTATSVASIVGVYYGLKTDITVLKLEIRVIEERISQLEIKKQLFRQSISKK
jgi:hypothetical protein